MPEFEQVRDGVGGAAAEDPTGERPAVESAVADSAVADSAVADSAVADSPAGESPVAAAMRELETLERRDLAEHPDVYQRIHGELQSALAAIDNA